MTTLTVVGDIMLARRVGSRFGDDDPAAPLRPLAKRLASAEITVGNFESTLSRDGNPTQGGDSFGADPEVVDGLKLAGIDLVSLANNHVGDYGDRALRRRSSGSPTGTSRWWARAGISMRRASRSSSSATGFGWVSSAPSPSARRPSATSDRAGTNRLNMPPRTGPLNRKALRRITGDIEALNKLVDAVVVIPHWGTQYTHRPEPSQREARAPSPPPAPIW